MGSFHFIPATLIWSFGVYDGLILFHDKCTCSPDTLVSSNSLNMCTRVWVNEEFAPILDWPVQEPPFLHFKTVFNGLLLCFGVMVMLQGLQLTFFAQLMLHVPQASLWWGASQVLLPQSMSSPTLQTQKLLETFFWWSQTVFVSHQCWLFQNCV